jgi:hypothetical protein
MNCEFTEKKIEGWTIGPTNIRDFFFYSYIVTRYCFFVVPRTRRARCCDNDERVLSGFYSHTHTQGLPD